MEIEKVDPRCLVAVREEVNAPWFSQRAVAQLAGPTVGALAAWSTTVVAEADFFSSEPEAREADEELMQLNRLRERWQPSFPEVDVGGSGLASPCAPSAWGCRVMMSPSSVQPSPSLRPAPPAPATPAQPATPAPATPVQP